MENLEIFENLVNGELILEENLVHFSENLVHFRKIKSFEENLE